MNTANQQNPNHEPLLGSENAHEIALLKKLLENGCLDLDEDLAPSTVTNLINLGLAQIDSDRLCLTGKGHEEAVDHKNK